MIPTTSPPEPQVRSTGTRFSRILGLLCLAGLAFLAVMGLVVSPADVEQGESVRFIYVHVPSAYLAYLSYAVTAFASVMYLWKRTRSLAWDRLAGASVEAGLLFTALCLFTGSMWGHMTWGTYWTWDARLTTTALLFLLFLGYVAIRRLPADPAVRARRCAIAGLVAFVDVPITHYSVTWWRSLHAGPTLSRLDPQIDDLMLFTLMTGIVVFSLVFVWMVLHGFRAAVLQDAYDDRVLGLAIDERRAEAGPPAAPAGVHS